MNQESDEGAIPADGDEERTLRFTRLYAANERHLKAVLFALLPNAAIVDEVLQRTSLVLWRKFDDLRSDDGFLRWASAVARFEVLAYRRDSARERLKFDTDLVSQLSEEYVDSAAWMETRRDALSSCMMLLKSREQKIMKVIYCDRMRIKDAAAALGHAPAPFYKTVDRIRSKLLQCVKFKLRVEQ